MNQEEGEEGSEEREKGVLLEEGLDLAGLLLDAGDDGLQVLVGVGIRRRRRHLAGDEKGGAGACFESGRAASSAACFVLGAMSGFVWLSCLVISRSLNDNCILINMPF